MKICALTLFGIALPLSGSAIAADAPGWRVEAEAAEVTKQAGVKVVDDAEASGGKAIEVPSEGVPQWNVVSMGLPAAATAPGRYQLNVRLKATDLPDIGRAWRMDVRQDSLLLGYGVAYGLYLRGKTGYQDYTLNFDWADGAKRPALYMRWNQRTEGKPTVRLDRFEFVRLGDLPAVRIRKVWPDRVRYLSKQDGDITVTVESFAAQSQEGKVRLELTHDLDAPVIVGEQPFTVEAGKTAEVKFPFKNPGRLFGFAARAVLLAGGKEADSREEYFCVHDNPWATATGNVDQEFGDYRTPWWALFYCISATDPEIEEAVMQAREQYVTCTEFFSWSPGECFDMAPDKEFWIRGNGGDLLRSKREIQRELAGLKRHGIGLITYIAYQAMGERTLEIFREKPHWFTFSPLTGDVLEFYNLNEIEKRKEFWKQFDWEKYKTEGNPNSPDWKDTPENWKKYKEFWKKPIEAGRKLSIIGYFCPNYTLPEVVDFCADQVIASSRMFGWDGLRWDCGHLNPGPIWGTFQPFVDFNGQPQAKTVEEMENITVANLQRLKARIRAQIPNFAIGTNFGSWMETHQYPKMVAELTRDGGWLLDEVCYGYNAPQSPYHFWEAYYAIMADEGEHVTRLGGHYNPFAFNRNGGKYPIDGIYETIIRIAGKGHPQSGFYNSRTPFGNFAQFCVRFGRFVFDPTMRRVEKPEEIVNVASPRPLWWKKTVNRLKEGDQDYLVVHLINPPHAKEVETDPTSTLSPTVQGTRVTATLPAGKKKASAWLLMAESFGLGDPPKTQAMPLKVQLSGGKASVAIPQIICWKMVVFRFE